MAKAKITKSVVDGAPAPVGNDAFIWDTEVRGFGLRITPRGVKSYVLQFRLRNRPARRRTIGVHGSPWTPNQARDEAKRLLMMVRQGVDPVDEERRRARDAVALEFEGYVERFTELCLKVEWKDSWALVKRRLELHVAPHLAGKAMTEIGTRDIAEVLDGLADRPALRYATHAALKRMFGWAKKRGDIPVSPMTDMDAPPQGESRERVLSDDELRAIWQASYKLDGSYGPWVRLLILTLQRRSEVAGLSWQEVDRERSLLVIPGARTKNNEGHVVPLNALAMAELHALEWKRRGLIFATSTGTAISGFSKKKAQLDKEAAKLFADVMRERGEEGAAAEIGHWTFHDLRRTGTTRMQSLGVPIDVTERVINHSRDKAGRLKGGLRKVYNLWDYVDEKRAALSAWGDHVARIVAARETAPTTQS